MILGKLCFETMRLETLTRIVQPILVKGPIDFEVEGLAYDSRQVRPNYLFVALHGRHTDGSLYIDEAIRRGAVAVVAESECTTPRSVAQIRVENARQALAEIACAYYGHPSQRLELMGITGTNGKTTTTFMARDMLRGAGRRCGLIGTVRYEMGGRVIPASRTTPEAPDVQFMLDQMVRAGCRSAVMEVSSHALDQKRVFGCDYDVAVFTNLTRDHLDYHETMPRYFTAKMQLFRSLGQQNKKASAVVNIDDPWGMELAKTNGLSARLITFGTHPSAMVRAEDVQVTPRGTTFLFRSHWGDAEVVLKQLGRFNVSNALAAMTACGVLGLEVPDMVRALAHMESVPGRLEQVLNRRGVLAFVDYAHTDDALANVLATLREIRRRRIIVVFGCGGDRDKSKRPLMGSVAVHLADHVIVTSDNPRNENPDEIIQSVVRGMGSARHFEVVPDREKAIARAAAQAQEGDILLVAGKGHENYQEFSNTVVPFDDRDVLRKYLA